MLTKAKHVISACFISSSLLIWYTWADEECIAGMAPVLNLTKILLAKFSNIPQTDEARQGEAIFNRKMTSFKLKTINDFLYDEFPIQIENLIDRLTTTDYLNVADSIKFKIAYNKSCGAQGYGELQLGTHDTSGSRWASHLYMSIRRPNENLMVAYAITVLTLEDASIKFTPQENQALMKFVEYKNHKSFNDDRAMELRMFSEDYEKCH